MDNSATGSFTDCQILNSHSTLLSGVANIQGKSSLNFLRTVVADASTGPYGGCFQLESSGMLTIEDSDIVNCKTTDATGHGGGMVRMVGAGSWVSIANSRISGSSSASKGSVAHIGDLAGPLRISGSTITDSSSGDGKFAVYDNTGRDFNIQVFVSILLRGDAAHNAPRPFQPFIFPSSFVHYAVTITMPCSPPFPPFIFPSCLAHGAVIITMLLLLVARFERLRRNARYLLIWQGASPKCRWADQHSCEERDGRYLRIDVGLLSCRVVLRRLCRHRLHLLYRRCPKPVPHRLHAKCHDRGASIIVDCELIP